MSRLAVPLAALLLVLTAASACADGLTQAYDYVYPPANLRAGNTPPYSGSGNVRFQRGKSVTGDVATNDFQAGINFDPGALPPVAGQTGVHVSILPLRHWQPLPAGMHLDGNVYSFRVRYTPSGQPVTHLLARALITMVYPLTPTNLLGFSNGGWKPLCPFKQALRAQYSISCYVHFVPTQISVVGNKPLPINVFAAVFILSLAAITVLLILGLLSLAIWRNFIRKPSAPAR